MVKTVKRDIRVESPRLFSSKKHCQLSAVNYFNLPTTIQTQND